MMICIMYVTIIDLGVWINSSLYCFQQKLMYVFKAHIIIPMIAFDIIYNIIIHNLVHICRLINIYVVKEVNSGGLVN